MTLADKIKVSIEKVKENPETYGDVLNDLEVIYKFAQNVKDERLVIRLAVARANLAIATWPQETWPRHILSFIVAWLDKP